MKVEPTGSIVVGVCGVQTPFCTAHVVPKPITVVFYEAEDGQKTQVNVCRRCIEVKIDAREWVIDGAKVLPDQRARIYAGVN